MQDNSTKDNKQNIVILGGGTAGWMSAAALVKLLPHNKFNITLVESDQISTVGVGEATLPHLRFFNQRLGIDEREFMRATQATFKVGIEFSNWGQEGDAYIHPFGDYGQKINDVGFHHFWLKEKSKGDVTPLDRYSLPVMACLNNKFDFPSSNFHDISSSYSYAYHIDATLYAKYLRNFSEKLGVNRKEGKVVDVIKRARDNYIEMLLLEDGTRISGDFFIDCSGFRSQLIGKTLGSEFEDWSHWLPCNSAVAMACELNDAPLTYTKAIAREAGWQWRIPLQNRLGNGYVYCDQFIDKQQALDTLTQNLTGKALSEPNFLTFKAGKRKHAWVNNCLAIGLSSGFLEPLESTSIYLIQSAIMKLVELIPQTENLEIKAKEYNRSLDMEMERIRDFLILHYHATNRTDSPFWDYCRTMDIPDSLKEKMMMFQETAHIQNYKHGLFLEPSWLAVYIGQGVFPTHYDGRVDLMDTGLYQTKMQNILKSIETSHKKMPHHLEIIKQFCEVGSRENNVLANMSLYGKRGF
jgi:tryptophan halogenase